MILLSAHKDVVFHPYKLSLNKGIFKGLLDNWVGVFVTTNIFFDEPNLQVLEKKGYLKVHYGDSEEFGTITSMPTLSKDDIVLVVDVCSGSQYKNVDISLENISGFTKDKIKEVKENLEWEGFKIRTKFYDGNPDDEDEAFYWHDLKQKVISFIIPINDGTNKTGWHNDDCTITYENVRKASQILKRLINYLIEL